MFDNLIESSRRDDSNKWSIVRSGEEISIIEIKICTLSETLLILHKAFPLKQVQSVNPRAGNGSIQFAKAKNRFSCNAGQFSYQTIQHVNLPTTSSTLISQDPIQV